MTCVLNLSILNLPSSAVQTELRRSSNLVRVPNHNQNYNHLANI